MARRICHQKSARRIPYVEGTAGTKALRLVLNGLLNSKETSMVGVKAAWRPGSDRMWWTIWWEEAQ